MDNSRYKLSLLAASAVSMMSDLIPNLLGTNPSYGINRKSKRQRINYNKHEQRKFTKILPHICARWDAMPQILKETRQLGRQSQLKAFKIHRHQTKINAMKSSLKGGSAALVFARG